MYVPSCLTKGTMFWLIRAARPAPFSYFFWGMHMPFICDGEVWKWDWLAYWEKHKISFTISCAGANDSIFSQRAWRIGSSIEPPPPPPPVGREELSVIQWFYGSVPNKLPPVPSCWSIPPIDGIWGSIILSFRIIVDKYHGIKYIALTWSELCWKFDEGEWGGVVPCCSSCLFSPQMIFPTGKKWMRSWVLTCNVYWPPLFPTIIFGLFLVNSDEISPESPTYPKMRLWSSISIDGLQHKSPSDLDDASIQM